MSASKLQPRLRPAAASASCTSLVELSKWVSHCKIGSVSRGPWGSVSRQLDLRNNPPDTDGKGGRKRGSGDARSSASRRCVFKVSMANCLLALMESMVPLPTSARRHTRNKKVLNLQDLAGFGVWDSARERERKKEIGRDRERERAKAREEGRERERERESKRERERDRVSE